MIPSALLDQLREKRSLTLTLKVVPKSSKNEIVGLLEDGSLKLKVTAAPEKGKANEAVRTLLAEAFGVPTRQVEIVRGATATMKQVRIQLPAG